MTTKANVVMNLHDPHPGLTNSAVVVVRTSRPIPSILMLKRSDQGTDVNLHSRWGFPGGKVDRGESYLETAVRELREETGLRWEHPHDQTPSNILTFPPYRIAVFTWTLRPGHRPLVHLNPDEHTTALWCTRDEALKLDLAGPGTRYILERLPS